MRLASSPQPAQNGAVDWGQRRGPGKPRKEALKVERDGWFIDIEPLEVSERPNWEMRCLIQRSTEDGKREQRHNRFFVPSELATKLGLAELSEEDRREALARGAKHIIMREIEEIFAEPEDGLDSVRALTEKELGSQRLTPKKRRGFPFQGGLLGSTSKAPS